MARRGDVGRQEGERDLRGDPRYRVRRALAGRVDAVAEATDLWTGRKVVLKAGPCEAAIRESHCLLAIPAGVGPRLLDVVWRGDGQVLQVLERVPGSTLGSICRGLPSDALPLLVRDVCQCLHHVHRSGWIQADLKPEHILVHRRDGGDRLHVRLVDFGFALSPYADRERASVGGTPPFMAPELLRGWIADGRADLYSLGRILQECFPHLEGRPSWTRILQRLTEQHPGKRYASAAEVRDEIESTFGLDPSADRLPGFGAGPTRGRRASCREVLDRLRARPGANVLVQALPGFGLSRFLLEAVLTAARSNAPGVRILDLPDLLAFRSRRAVTRALDFIETQNESSVLCGIADSSPGLRWSEPLLRERLERILAGRGKWFRIRLPAIDGESQREVIASSLGTLDPATEVLSFELRRRAEGDLRTNARDFLRCVREGRDQGLAWKLDPDRLAGAFAGMKPHPSCLPLVAVSAELANALALCARAGFSVPERLIQRLFARHGDVRLLGELTDYGLLERDADRRLRFATRDLWMEASARPVLQGREIDRWLTRRFVPDPERVEDILQSCRIAFRAGDRTGERDRLGQGIARAHAQRRWPDLLRLLAYPDEPPGVWTEFAAQASVARLCDILSPSWSRARILTIAGQALSTVIRDHGLSLLSQAANSTEDAGSAMEARFSLLDRVADRVGDPDYARHVGAIRSRLGDSEACWSGALAFMEARQRLALRQAPEANASAAEAAALLRGSGLYYEPLALLTLAALQFEDDRPGAVRSLQRALAVADSPELQAQIRYNLALMCNSMGRLTAAASYAEIGIRSLYGRVSPARWLGLRMQRAWSLAALDQIDQAKEEAEALLELSQVRLTPRRLVPVRLLIGFCHLHRGSNDLALRETIRGTTEAMDPGVEGRPRQYLRYLIDALIDCDAVDLATEHAQLLQSSQPVEDPLARLAGARGAALLSQARGSLADAERILAENLPHIDRANDLLSSARYLHQLATVVLARAGAEASRARAREAAKLFAREIEVLPPTGHAYVRARAMLGRARALRAAGREMESLATVSRSIRIARRIRSLAVLAECLTERARIRMRGDPFREDS